MACTAMHKRIAAFVIAQCPIKAELNRIQYEDFIIRGMLKFERTGEPCRTAYLTVQACPFA